MKRLFVLLLIIAACNTEQEQFSILGEWKGSPWYCNNVENCKINEADVEAYVTFRIESINDDGTLIISDMIRYVPSCAIDPRCEAHPWVVKEATYINDELRIVWEELGHEFIGRRNGDVIVGEMVYRYDEFEYMWNDEIEIKRE